MNALFSGLKLDIFFLVRSRTVMYSDLPMSPIKSILGSGIDQLRFSFRKSTQNVLIPLFFGARTTSTIHRLFLDDVMIPILNSSLISFEDIRGMYAVVYTGVIEISKVS